MTRATQVKNLEIRGGDHGNYALHNENLPLEVRGFVRRNRTGGGYTVTLDGCRWTVRNLPPVAVWSDLAAAIVATKPATRAHEVG